jgi:RNA polymerase sigma-70 factor (ECF subfamily)
MDEPQGTRVSLLVRIRDPAGDEAWRQFVALYAPLVYGFSRRRGLQDADAADLTQDVLRAVTTAAGRLQYDPQRGSFRSWLFTVARNNLNTFLDNRRRRPGGQGDGGTSAQIALEEHPAREDDEALLWGQDFQRQRFAWAAGQIRGGFEERSWQAFWRTAVEGRPARQVAVELGLSLGAVYIARSRILARLRERIRELPTE